MLTSTGTEPRYRIIEALGRGGMGEVCLAEDLILDREVALKFLASDEGDALEQLLNEARAAAALDHPFICKIYEVTNLDGRPCIVMEYVRGETLERRLRRGPLPLDEGLRIAEEIAEALEAAHKRRFIHRDLKPANVMVTEDHHIKVMDFGLAVRLAVSEDERTIAVRPGEEGMLLGTPAYMAPEQIGGSPADRRSDIFAFGIVLYETLSGVHPFRRTGIEATLAAIVGEIAPELHGHAPSVPIAVSEVVAKMLAKHPASRYQSFGDLRLDLRRLAGELTAPAPVRPVIVEAPRDDERVPLFGRESERSELLQAINKAVAGRGALIVLAGEAGVGKSRLAEEALAAGRRLGCQTLVGRCHEQDGTPPLIPYIEVLEEAARVIPVPTFRQAVGRTAPELARLLPELHRLFPDIPPAMELPPELRQRFLFTNFREFLTRCSSATPLVIFLDDLQWADESTLQLTQHLAQHLDSLPIVVIAGYRDVGVAAEPQQAGALNQLFRRVRGQSRDATAASQIVARGLEQLVAKRVARMVTLRPLSENDVRGMLGALGHGDPPSRLVRKFVDQTGGNPFFIEELFRNLSEEGRLFDGGGKWKRDLELNDLDVPSSVRLVIDRRLQRVSGDTQNVLKAAAVIGQHFELDLLDAVTDVDEEALMTALEEAEQAHLLKGPSGRQERRWRFAHQLICQTLTGAVPQLRRQRLHIRIADAMAQLDAETYKSEIAHHLYSAGPMADATRTARALMTAGDAAHTMYATEDAVQHYRRAIEVLNEGGGDEATLLGVQERLADLLTLLGDRGAAMEHYQALAAAHEKSGARIDLARQVRKIGTLYWQGGDRTQAIQCYQRALGALDGMSAHIEAAHLYQELGLTAFRSGDNVTAIAWAEGALSSAEAALADSASVTPETRRAAAAAIAHATNTIGVALARSGQLDAARERIEHSVNAAREHGLLDVACRGYANLGVLYSTVEPKKAIDVSLTGLELASKIGAASLQSYIYANLATAYCALTERCESEGLMAAQTAANLDRELGQLDHLAVPLIVMAQIHQCQGELERAQEVYREALALADKMAEPQLQLPCYEGLATIYLDRGDRRLAEEYMEKGRVLCERTGIDPDTLLLLPFLC
jgi:adenylate cyclase